MPAKKYKEIYVLSQKFNLPSATIEGRFIKAALAKSEAEVDAITKFIRAFLP
ncbi:MAG: hypothetical protein ACLQU4_21900 [Limisphaerales bacterium]